MKEEKTKSKLPGLTELFRFTVVIGLLRGLWTTCQMFVDYAVFWGTAYAGLAAIDIGLRIIELVLYAGMLVYIALRKRTFLICFWADVGCRVMTLLVVLFAGGSAAEFLTPLILPLVWAAYFYLSDNFSDAFTPYREPFLLRLLRGKDETVPLAASKTPPRPAPAKDAQKKEQAPSSPPQKQESASTAAPAHACDAQESCSPPASAAAGGVASPTPGGVASAAPAPPAPDAASDPAAER